MTATHFLTKHNHYFFSHGAKPMGRFSWFPAELSARAMRQKLPLRMYDTLNVYTQFDITSVHDAVRTPYIALDTQHDRD